MGRMRLALVGLGKIAQDRHIPAILGAPGLELVAGADPAGSLPGLPCFPGLDALLERGPAFDAVALCTPPRVRPALAARALAAGRHVLMEKPPAATLGAVAALTRQAQRAGRTLYATWHSRHAPAVEPARALLAGRRVSALQVTWKEDVEVWHPGQPWIWEPGGFGVFDPAINAFSILTRILPEPPVVTGCELVFPEGGATPIAAELRLAGPEGCEGQASLDWRPGRPQEWTIALETEVGRVVLERGGRRLLRDGALLAEAEKTEYQAIYARFRELAARGESEVDLSPLAMVADAFLLGRRVAEGA